MSVPSDEEFAEIKRRAVERLADLPGVYAVGVGSKEVGGVLTGEPAIKVFLTRKLPLDEIPVAERIPETIDGIRTDVVETGEVHLATAPPSAPPGAKRPDNDDHGDDGRNRPSFSLIGGSKIMPASAGEGGTLGCFVWDKNDHGKVYALTNYHVIHADDVSKPTVGITEVGQPLPGSCSGYCQGTIGKYAGGGRIVAKKKENEEYERTDRDEALVRLDPGMKWMADILGIGADEAAGPVRGIHPVTEKEAFSKAYRVRKRGKRTRLTGGVLSGLVSGVSIADNILIVKPNPAPTIGTSFFAWKGDSGSALVNDENKVVGLLYGVTGAGHGIALMIVNVLSRLADDLGGGVTLEVATAEQAGVVNTVPGATMVAAPQEVVSALGGSPAALSDSRVIAAVDDLEQDLDRSPSGRWLVAFWHEHRSELSALVNQNRRIAITWHRSGAAAIFQLLTRMAVDPGVRMPAMVNGQPLSSCIDQVHAMLGRFASPRLREDLERIRASLPDVAGLTYPQILDILDQT